MLNQIKCTIKNKQLGACYIHSNQYYGRIWFEPVINQYVQFFVFYFRMYTNPRPTVWITIVNKSYDWRITRVQIKVSLDVILIESKYIIKLYLILSFYTSLGSKAWKIKPPMLPSMHTTYCFIQRLALNLVTPIVEAY